MNKYAPVRLIIYQHSKAENPWAVEVERTSGKHARQDFCFRIFSECFNCIASDWLIVDEVDLNHLVNNVCNCLKMLNACNKESGLFASCPEDYAHIREEIRKTFFT